MFDTWNIGERMETKGVPEYLIQDLIVENSQVLLYAPTGHCKSFAAIDIACHIATGRPYHGRKVKQGNVFYIAAEGAAEIEQRMLSWEHHFGNTLRNRLLFIDSPLQLHDAEQMNTLRQKTIEHGVTLVVFDTAEKCTIGTDENLPAQVNLRVNEPLECIKNETGATTLLVHHQGSGKTPRWRGTQAYGTPCDTIMRVATTFEKNQTRDTPTRLTLKVEKQRGGEPFDLAFNVVKVPKIIRKDGADIQHGNKTTLVLEPATVIPAHSRENKSIVSKSKEKLTNPECIIAALKQHGPLDRAALLEHSGVPRNSIGSSLKRLTEKSMVILDDGAYRIAS